MEGGWKYAWRKNTERASNMSKDNKSQTKQMDDLLDELNARTKELDEYIKSIPKRVDDIVLTIRPEGINVTEKDYKQAEMLQGRLDKLMEGTVIPEGIIGDTVTKSLKGSEISKCQAQIDQYLTFYKNVKKIQEN